MSHTERGNAVETCRHHAEDSSRRRTPSSRTSSGAPAANVSHPFPHFSVAFLDVLTIRPFVDIAVDSDVVVRLDILFRRDYQKPPSLLRHKHTPFTNASLSSLQTPRITANYTQSPRYNESRCKEHPLNRNNFNFPVPSCTVVRSHGYRKHRLYVP